MLLQGRKSRTAGTYSKHKKHKHSRLPFEDTNEKIIPNGKFFSIYLGKLSSFDYPVFLNIRCYLPHKEQGKTHARTHETTFS